MTDNDRHSNPRSRPKQDALRQGVALRLESVSGHKLDSQAFGALRTNFVQCADCQGLVERQERARRFASLHDDKSSTISTFAILLSGLRAAIDILTEVTIQLQVLLLAEHEHSTRKRVRVNIGTRLAAPSLYIYGLQL